MIELLLVTFLRAHAPLTAVLGPEKVFFAEALQGTAYDYVVVHKISGNRLRKVGFGSPLMQISYFSKSQFRALAGAEIIIAALDGYAGTWGTLRIAGDYQNDLVFQEDDVFHAPVDMRINYLEI